MKSYWLITMLLISSALFSSPDLVRDSILQSLKKNKNSRQQLELMLQTSFKIQQSHPRLLKELGESALQLSRQLEDRASECQALIIKSLYYAHTSNFDSALFYIAQAHFLARKVGADSLLAMTFEQNGLILMTKGLNQDAINNYKSSLKHYRNLIKPSYSGIYNNLAIAFSNLKQTDSAIHYYFQALRSDEKKLDQTTKGIILGNIAVEYSNKKDYRNAIKHYTEAIQYLEASKADLVNLANNYVNLGVAFRMQHESDSALKWFYLGKKLYQEIEDQAGVARVALNLGNLLTDLNRYEEGEKSYFESLEICKQLRISQGITMNYINLGSLYQKINKLNKALFYLRKADSLNAGASLELELAITEGFYETYKSSGDYRKALSSLEKHAAVRDSLTQQQQAIKLEEIHAQYQYELQKHENQSLRNENALKQKTIDYHRLLNYAFIGLVIIILSIVTQVIISRRRLKNLYHRLEMKKNRIEQQAAELEEANNTKDKLFSIIAHDLRGPFNTILGMAEILEEETRTETNQTLNEYASMLQRSSQVAYDLLENLLLWSKAQRGLIKPDTTQLNLRSLIDEVVGLLIHQASREGIKIENQADPMLNLTTDADLLRTVIRNITSNALKFTPNQGTITLRTTETPEWITLDIADTGNGMKPEQLEAAFGNNSQGAKTPGNHINGLGLLICKEFTQLLGGQLSATSIWHQGTTVTIKLPKA